jgi:hypothetical protein
MSDLHVNDQFRKNALSLQDGGFTVGVTYENGKRYLYDKVKSPKRYIRMISDRGRADGFIVAIHLDDKLVWEKSRGGNPWDFLD